MCVITTPCGRGRHSPRWAAEPEKTINNNNKNMKNEGIQFFTCWINSAPHHENIRESGAMIYFFNN
jgi:hypothetical protein